MTFDQQLAVNEDVLNQLLPILEERHQLFILEKKRMRSLVAEFYSNRRILAWHNAAMAAGIRSLSYIPREPACWRHLSNLIAQGRYGEYIRTLLIHIRTFYPHHSHISVFTSLSLTFGPPGPKLRFI